jgi:hypothetical protein
MRKLFKVTPFLFCLLALVACNNGGGAAVAAEDKPKDTTTAAETEEIKPMPDNLKHEGYQYYGLDKAEELTYDFDNNGMVQQGTQKHTYKGMASGSPQYAIERSEALSILGVDTVEVKEDGIYLVSAREQKLEKPVLALPAKLEVGKTWQIDQKLKDVNGADVSTVATQKVEKAEKITVAGQSYDCIVISMSGKITTGGKTQDVTGKTWYSAGVGTVKLELNSKDPAGKPTKYVIALSKPKAPEKTGE